MKTKRLSLSNSVYSGRTKKFDAYQHVDRATQRATVERRVVKPHKRKVVTSNTTPFRSEAFRSVFNRPTLRKKHAVISAKTQPTHLLALQAVANTQPYQGVIFPTQLNFAAPTAKSLNPNVFKLLYIAAAFVFLFALTVSVQTFLANRETKQQIEEVLGAGAPDSTIDEQGVVQGTGDKPSEQKISAAALSNYRISNPEEPRYLRIPSLDIYSRIKPLGVKDGTIDAPWNINDVGWYDGSTRPGNSRGSSLLLGHISGWSDPGVFKHLASLKPGEQFEVEKGSGEKIRYEVVNSRSIPIEQIEMSEILSTEVSGVHDLKLMTCSGKYNKDTEKYAERMVVYAKILRS